MSQRHLIPLPGGRHGYLVEADDAGEFTIRVHECWLDAAEAAGLLTWRQAEALRELSRLYLTGGGSVPFKRTSAGPGRDETAAALARVAERELLDAVSPWLHPMLHDIARGLVPRDDVLPALRAAADRLADRLRLDR
jgi:hypothetical protein